MSKLEVALLLFALVPWTLVGAGAALLLRHFLRGKTETAQVAHDAFGFLKAQTLEEKARLDHLATQPVAKAELGPLAKKAEADLATRVLAGEIVKDAHGHEWTLV